MLFSMRTGADVVSVELYQEMKPCIITSILQADEDPALTDNWRPIALLNVDYELLVLVYAA